MKRGRRPVCCDDWSWVALNDSEIIDLLVVGGGINGAGIARDAAGRGLKVVLCEQGDLANHTSSASTKLIHGGLRYLEYYEFRLVREALIEREVLLNAARTSSGRCALFCPTAPSSALHGSFGSGSSCMITSVVENACRHRLPSTSIPILPQSRSKPTLEKPFPTLTVGSRIPGWSC